MSIPGVGTTLVRLLESRYKERHGGLEGLSFELFTTSDFEGGSPLNKVSLFLYRLEIDPTQRHRELAPVAMGGPPRLALALNLRYLLTVWVKDAEREHQILQDCIEILDRDAIVPGALLDQAYTWESDTALKVTLDSVSHEDMMRLWDLLDPKYRLSVPLFVRTVRLTPVDQPAAPPVTARVSHVRQGVR
ncbi:DUF4255 domain-containing protein [Sorangium sp. So ce1182]|uniref:DUF4255 domain-containing protein n=1 Tax=Sorangium sp. So ce1182 TaxID=3133334 RepID=UPI003F5DBD5D